MLYYISRIDNILHTKESKLTASATEFSTQLTTEITPSRNRGWTCRSQCLDLFIKMYNTFRGNSAFGFDNAWCRVGDKPFSQVMLIYFINASRRHGATSTVYWCIASKLKAPQNFYWMSNMFLWVEIFLFFVCYHVVPKRHSRLDYELNGL